MNKWVGQESERRRKGRVVLNEKENDGGGDRSGGGAYLFITEVVSRADGARQVFEEGGKFGGGWFSR